MTRTLHTPSELRLYPRNTQFYTPTQGKMIKTRPPRRRQPSGGVADCVGVDVSEVTPACAKATRKYPEGRTGTTAGQRAHQRAGEQPCTECAAATAAYLARYAVEHKDRIAAYNRSRRDHRQELLDELKSVPCADCGNTFPPICMDFDHVDESKSFTISRASTRSIETVLKEINKCQVVCANCHRIRTANRLVRKHPKGA